MYHRQPALIKQSGPRYKNPFKLTEHELMNWCISYLTLKQHNVQRINSGRVFVDDMRRGKRTIMLAEKGTPDICGYVGRGPHMGKALYIEVKVKPNKPEPAQVEFLETAKAHGCIAGVIYTQEELEQFVEEQEL